MIRPQDLLCPKPEGAFYIFPKAPTGQTAQHNTVLFFVWLVQSAGKFSGKITGKVTEVCQEKGCWMKIERENGEQLMVKFKDYGFFMPTDIA